MAVNLSPIGNDAPYLDSSGNPLNLGEIYTYVANSSTPANTYTTSAGNVANANPIILNSGGYPESGSSVVEVWLTAGTSYKFVLKNAAGTTLWTRDNITGINDTSVSVDQWVSGPAPTYVSATSFTLVGDQTSTFHVGRRIKSTNSGGTIYSTILTTAYGALTTVTVANDSGTLDAGLSAVSYALISAMNTSDPLLSDAYPIRAGSADGTKRVRFEVDGLTTNTTRVITIPDFDFTPLRENLIDAAGDLIYGTADNVAARLAIGTARQILRTNAGATAPAWDQPITLSSTTVTTSGTVVELTGIPANVRRITGHFDQVSTNGTSNFIFVIGDAGGYETADYFGAGSVITSAVSTTAFTASFGIPLGVNVGLSGMFELKLMDVATNLWAFFAVFGDSNTRTFVSGGSKALSDVLTQVKFTSASADTFDSGKVSFSYE